MTFQEWQRSRQMYDPNPQEKSKPNFGSRKRSTLTTNVAEVDRSKSRSPKREKIPISFGKFNNPAFL